MDAAHIADKYIARDGGPPQLQEKKIKTHADRADLLKVACFIGWHDDRDMWGGVHAEEAFEALCRLLALNPVALKTVVGRDFISP